MPLALSIAAVAAVSVTAASPSEGTGVVLAAPEGTASDGGVVTAGGVARRTVGKGDPCGSADCPQCRGGKHSRHHGTGGPEIPGCPAHCPVRPDRFGYYQTNWRRWPGNAVKPASFDEQAVPISPPKSVVPDIDEEAGVAEDGMVEDADSTPEADDLPEPPAVVPRAAPEGVDPPAPSDPAPTKPATEPAPPQPPKSKTADDLFEPASSAAPVQSSTLSQWRARRRAAPTAIRQPEHGTDGPRTAANVEPVGETNNSGGAANQPAEVDAESPAAKPIRVAAPLRR